MRAYAIGQEGAAPTVTDVPDPLCGKAELLVRVAASSVNGFDLAVAAGRLVGMMEHRYPVVLGKDFAGTVEAVGDGVAGFAPGDRVFGVVMRSYVGDGGLGELLVVDPDLGVADVPDGLEMPTAGALGLAGAAAVDSVGAIAPASGETVLVSGATGGVGALAIQYVVAAGATVVATARPGDEAALVRDLGAGHTVDHTADLAAQVRAVAPDGVDAVLHFAGDAAALVGLLTPDGRLASTLGFGADQHPAATAVLAAPSRPTLDRLAADVAAGRIRVPVTRTYPLADAGQALADFSTGTLGKLAVAVS